MNAGIPKEIVETEKRVAATPDTVKKLVAQGVSVSIESGAGDSSFFPNEAYEAVGASIVPDASKASMVSFIAR